MKLSYRACILFKGNNERFLTKYWQNIDPDSEISVSCFTENNYEMVVECVIDSGQIAYNPLFDLEPFGVYEIHCHVDTLPSYCIKDGHCNRCILFVDGGCVNSDVL